MPTIYFDGDADIQELSDSVIGVVGYGNQGRAHALNLRDSGLSVHVGTRDSGPSRQIAARDGFEPRSFQNIAANCDVIALLLPDESIGSVYTNSIEPHLTSHRTFVFAHGFAVHHKLLRLPSDADILLVAPTGPGRQLRSLYMENKGLPALVAVEQDGSGRGWQKCLAYASGLGCTRAGAIETTFREETITDLYCEQAVLCGGLPELIKSSFKTLVEAGYQPELAYISCLKEVKLIADLLSEKGLSGMREAISNTARAGSSISGPELVDSRTEERLRSILERIETGEFARWFLENPRAAEEFTIREKHSGLEKTGRFLKKNLRF